MAAQKFDLKYKIFEDWCIAHAGSLPRVSAETAEERSLANWLKNKLSSCRQGKLPDDQLAKLREIPGFSDFPHVSQESRKRVAEFDRACKNFEDWRAGQPSLNERRASPKQMSVAVWLKNKLAFYRRGKLPDDELTKLRTICCFGTPGGPDATEEDMNIPINFGNRQNHVRDKDLAPEALDKPSNASIAAERLLKESQESDLRYKSFEAWCASNGTLPRRNGESVEERSLASWLKRKLMNYRRGALSSDELVKLKQIPCLSAFPNVSGTSQMLAERFERTYTSYKQWSALHGGAFPKESAEAEEERSLAIWFRNKLYKYRHGKLPAWQLAELKKFPHFTERSPRRSQEFDSAFRRFANWCASHEDALPKRSGEREESSLAIWLKNQVHRYRHGKLPDELLVKLRKIPALSDFPSVSVTSKKMLAEKFDLHYQGFKEWCARHTDMLPKQSGESLEERSLASWLNNKLFSYRHGKLPDDQLAKLRKIPGLSDFLHVSRTKLNLAQKLKFDLTYKSFQDWCAMHDGALPKRNGVSKEERSLANWLMHKLHSYRHDKLPAYQLAQLEKSPWFLERLAITKADVT